MSLVDLIFNTCGSSYIGIYSCSKCGYKLLQSGLEKKGFFKKSGLTLKDFFPPSTIAAEASSRSSSKTLNDSKDSDGDGGSNNSKYSLRFNNKSMLEDFTTNWNLGKTFRKDAILRKTLGDVSGNQNSFTRYEILCGKCGSSLGRHILNSEGGSFEIKPNAINLRFRTS